MGTNQRQQIVMSDAEIAAFVDRSRTATLATYGADGGIHLVAMWYGVIDGEIWFETKAKSQKAVNLGRDARCSVLIEDGDTYDTLRGVAFEGLAEIYNDPDNCHRVGVSVWGTGERGLGQVRRREQQRTGPHTVCRFHVAGTG
ncbi:pyridoxamine 5'-phosphate oxidase family protein, partial [Gordonia aichiensis]